MLRIASALIAAALVLPLHAAVTTNVDFPIQWSMTTSQCAVLTSDVTGNGNFHLLTAVTQDANGGFHLAVATTANGTATDANGAQYVFNYANQFTLNATPGFEVTRTDAFTLEPQGPGGTHLEVRFVRKFVVNANGTVTVNSFKVGGDLGCDPI